MNMKFDTSKYTVLYAQENKRTSNICKEYLEEKFEKVYITDDGREALEFYKNKKVDIIILDDNISHFNGFEIASKVRQQDINIKIILLISFLDEKILFEAVELCPLEYIHKPIEKIKLAEVLHKIICELEKKHQTNNYFYLPEDYIWEKTKKILIYDSNAITLTKNETLLMEFLCSEKERVFSSQEIMEFFWENDGNNDLTFDALRGLIKRIRKKLPPNSIINIVNRGYYLKSER